MKTRMAVVCPVTTCRLFRSGVLALVLLLLSACTLEPSEKATLTAIAAIQVVPSITPSPTPTMAPTATPTPTPTVTPTEILTPTPKPAPIIAGTWVELNDNSSPGGLVQVIHYYSPDGQYRVLHVNSGQNSTDTFTYDTPYSMVMTTSKDRIEFELVKDNSLMVQRYQVEHSDYVSYLAHRDETFPVLVHSLSKDPDLNGNVYMVYAGPEFRTELLTHNNSDEAPAFSPDNSKIAFIRYKDTNQDGKADFNDSVSNLFLMDLQGTNLQQVTNIEDQVWNFSWSPDGEQIVFGSLWSCYLLNLADRKVSPFLEGTRCNFPTFSPDGEWISLWTRDITGRLFPETVRLDILEQSRVLLTDSDVVHTLAWMADGRVVAESSTDEFYVSRADGTEKLSLGTTVDLLAANPQNLYNWADQPPDDVPSQGGITTADLAQLQPPDSPTTLSLGNFKVDTLSALGFASDASLVAAGTTQGEVFIWDLHSGKLLTRLEQQTASICKLLFSEDNQYLLTSECRQDEDQIKKKANREAVGEINRYWHVLTGKKMLTFPPFQGAIYTPLLLHPAGYVLMMDTHQPNQIWRTDARGNNLTSVLYHPNLFTSVSFSSNGARIAMEEEGQFRISNLTTGEWINTLKTNFSPLAYFFTPDARALALLDPKHKLQIFDIDTGKLLRTLVLPADLYQVEFSKDGQYLIVVNAALNIELWGVNQ